MNGRHTPGPWDAALERGCHGVISRSLPEGGANFVCIVGNDTETPEREPERFANARLIAAAPELLEALEQVLIEYDDVDLADNEPQSLTSAINAARAAIAKAKGGDA